MEKGRFVVKSEPAHVVTSEVVLQMSEAFAMRMSKMSLHMLTSRSCLLHLSEAFSTIRVSANSNIILRGDITLLGSVHKVRADRHHHQHGY